MNLYIVSIIFGGFMSQFRKPVSELTIQDNFMFCKVMENPLICQEMLEILLGDKILMMTKPIRYFTMQVYGNLKIIKNPGIFGICKNT